MLLCTVSTELSAQDEADVHERPVATLHIGDDAPPLRIATWLKGAPVNNFEKGRVYVLEFWASWCAPCRAAMPHISRLAEKYRDKVTVIGVDVYEQRTPAYIKAFVDSLGQQMNYTVAAEDSNYMAKGWLAASGQTGVPSTMIIDGNGKLAWLGHPMYLEKYLRKVLANNWDLQKARANRTRDQYLDSLDGEAYYRLIPYRDLPAAQQKGRPELALLATRSMVLKEPGLQYRFHIGYETFTALLKTDMHEACRFGYKALASGDRLIALDFIIGAISTYSDQLTLTPEIYLLGANAQQVLIDLFPYPELVNMEKQYNKLSDWYARAGKGDKAARAQKKSVEAAGNKQ